MDAAREGGSVGEEKMMSLSDGGMGFIRSVDVHTAAALADRGIVKGSTW